MSDHTLDVILPQLGESVVEGTITRWHKNVGDTVAVGEVLYEVSTDKVDSEVPSDHDGVLVAIVVADGATVAVGTVLAHLAPGSQASGLTARYKSADMVGSQPGAPLAEVPRNVADGEPLVSPAPPNEPGVDASPLVRQVARTHAVDLAQVVGTGFGGRITRADVEEAIAAMPRTDGAPDTTPPPTAAANLKADVVPARVPGRVLDHVPAGAPEEWQRVPMNRIRQRTAAHMVTSKATSPHAVTAMEVRYDAVERVRRARGAEFRAREGFSLTYLPFIARATIDALAAFPHLNARVDGDDLLVARDVHLAIAVDLAHDGLVAPVIRDANTLRLGGLARRTRALADAARAGGLGPDDLTGGTFTITNSGAAGTHFVVPIINQPQVAILSTDGISRKPVVVTTPDGGEALGIGWVGILTLSWDHRAFDGAYAAAFLAQVRDHIEHRNWDAEL